MVTIAPTPAPAHSSFSLFDVMTVGYPPGPSRKRAVRRRRRTSGASISYPVPHAAQQRIHRMTRFLARRLLNYVILLALASILAFTLTSLTFSPLDSLLE